MSLKIFTVGIFQHRFYYQLVALFTCYYSLDFILRKLHWIYRHYWIFIHHNWSCNDYTNLVIYSLIVPFGYRNWNHNNFLIHSPSIVRFAKYRSFPYIFHLLIYYIYQYFTSIERYRIWESFVWRLNADQIKKKTEVTWTWRPTDGRAKPRARDTGRKVHSYDLLSLHLLHATKYFHTFASVFEITIVRTDF